ncbi:hypothetical protein [Hufsiella ginkgonis]|uniref:Uncharacterized protein n=1 Tax=Hufsiella ginkgonis TaxID=2695274 RepID=A0A7K1Y3T9_9SPHI|nr:hypothetical protein [Hufsiella ginkgonis]MXV17930.1 hypothetical protein [Hufsiella ginkgonis]
MEISINRLWLLLRKQSREYKKIYLLGFPALIAIGLVWLIYNSGGEGLTNRYLEDLFVCGIFLSSGLHSLFILNRHRDKTSSIHELMLPCTVAEKTCAAVISGMVLYPLLYIFVIYPVTLLLCYIDRVMGFYNNIFVLWDMFRQPGFICFYFVFQSIILLCSVTFKRQVILKTIVVVCCLFFGTLYLNELITKVVFDISGIAGKPGFEHLSSTPFTSVYLYDQHQSAHIKPSVYQQTLFLAGYYLALPVIWITVFFRLKEKQI